MPVTQQKKPRSQLRGRQAKPIVARVAREYAWHGMPTKRKQKLGPEWRTARKFDPEWAGTKGKAGRRRRARRRARKRITAVIPTS